MEMCINAMLPGYQLCHSYVRTVVHQLTICTSGVLSNVISNISVFPS